MQDKTFFVSEVWRIKECIWNTSGAAWFNSIHWWLTLFLRV